MIETIIIDDERPALRELEFLLKDNESIKIIGSYTNPFEGFEAVRVRKPKAVFLDIDMPKRPGLELASMILEFSPHTDIIFVTAYDKYAIEAFEMQALDYIMKPIAKERLDKTISKLIKENNIDISNEQKDVEITCLGEFSVSNSNGEIKWRTEKTMELFAYLVHNRGRLVTKEIIIEDLWPETDIDKAIHQIHNGIYYIRKTLEKLSISNEQINISQMYCLRVKDIKLDVDALYKCIDELKTNMTLENLEKLDSIYTGEYFKGMDWAWADIERAKLQRIYNEYILKLSQMYIERNDLIKAEDCLYKAYKNDPYDEIIMEMMMRVYKHSGNKSKAAKCLKEYIALLKNELGVNPSNKIIEMYKLIH